VRRAWTVNLRNHRKLAVIDGAVGFTGGINIGDEFLPWRDVHLRVEGPAVRQLQQIFLADWFFTTREDLVSRALFDGATPSGDSVTQLVQSGPDATVEAIHHLYFAAIASARERVLLSTPYFVPDRAILVALQTAALRGVDVRLVLPSRSNHRVTFHAGRSFYDELLDAGVHVHEYQGGFVHSKIAVVDGSFATVGTANLDVRSFRLNFELLAVLWDAKVVADLEALFEEDLRQASPVDLPTWRSRGFLLRIAEGVGRLFAPLL
jgi:cardiolipin synthase